MFEESQNKVSRETNQACFSLLGATAPYSVYQFFVVSLLLFFCLDNSGEEFDDRFVGSVYGDIFWYVEFILYNLYRGWCTFLSIIISIFALKKRNGVWRREHLQQAYRFGFNQEKGTPLFGTCINYAINCSALCYSHR